MRKDSTQRRNERWETLFPGIDLEGILGRILRIAHHHARRSTETMRPFGIKNCEADVLAALLHAGAPHVLTPTEITRHSYRTPGAITNVLDHLEEKGLLLRSRDASNRRSVLVELTPKGLEVARESFLAQTVMEKRFLSMLDPDEKEQLRALLKRIMLRLEEEENEGR